VLPSAGRDILIQVQRPEAAAKKEFKGEVVLGNPQGIQFEKPSMPVTLKAGQTQALVRFRVTLQPSRMFSFGGRLVDAKGRSVVSMAARRYSIVETFAEGKIGDIVLKYAVTLDGDPKVPAEAKLTYCKAPGGAPVDVCAKLDYSFSSGWRFVKIAQGMPLPISEKPLYAKVWVKGDGGNGGGRLRFNDAGGQTFQPDFGPLNFTDWRCLQADMSGRSAGHRGGANDGRVAYPLKWDTLFLVDNVGAAESKGSIYIGPAMLYYD
jgi:hypothetical protein